MKHDYVTITIPRWHDIEVPEGMFGVAVKRTSHLQVQAYHKPLREVLASAYIQGIHDAEAVTAGAALNAAMKEPT